MKDKEFEEKGIWIEESLWLSSLSLLEKCILAEIIYCNSKPPYLARVDYFSEIFNEPEKKVKNAIKLLHKKGLLNSI